MSNPAHSEEELHAASVEQLERRIMELALEATGARDGAIFLWDEASDGLAIDFHVVGGLTVNIPNAILHRREGRPNGVAFRCFDANEPVISNDTSLDPSLSWPRERLDCREDSRWRRVSKSVAGCTRTSCGAGRTTRTKSSLSPRATANEPTNRQTIKTRGCWNVAKKSNRSSG